MLIIYHSEKQKQFKIRVRSDQISCSVVSDSLRPHESQHARPPCPWDSPGKNTGVGCHALLQGIFLTEGLNLCLLHLLHFALILPALLLFSLCSQPSTSPMASNLYLCFSTGFIESSHPLVGLLLYTMSSLKTKWWLLTLCFWGLWPCLTCVTTPVLANDWFVGTNDQSV